MNSRLYSWPQVIATIVLIISGVLGLLISRHPKNKPQYSSGTISESLIPTNSMELQLSPPLLTTKQSVHQFEPTNPSYLTNWNKCINVADGYSIKYPSTFYLPSSEQNDCRTFISDEEDLHFHAAIELFLFDNPKRISFIEWLESPAANNAGILKPSHKGMNIRTKKIGSIEWLTFTGQVTPGFPPSGRIYWATLHNQKVILIGLTNLDIGKYESTVESMLSTLQLSNEQTNE